ncbi:MAG: hypothetical protein GY803_04555 [Chloroflexi bacterium]|nr:hypothetical protein [Chloroflexota bacterium]
MGRVFTLTGYFARSLLWSLAGLIYVILALAYWNLFFPPGQGTPHVENYILIIGAFGAAITFLTTLSIAARANRAVHFPMVTRLPSRVEYLTAVLLSSVIVGTLLQLLVAVLAMFRGPGLVWGRLLEIPPLWIAMNVLTAVLAMHATDFVTAGWSRVYLFGLLGLFMLGNNAGGSISDWMLARFSDLSRTINRLGWYTVGDWVNRAGQWFSDGEPGLASRIFDWLVWPFTAISDAVINGFFNTSQALAPAVILLYATILFLLAADLLAGKDLEFIE